MCGIIGYTGPLEAKNILLDGLSRLEYRGYDSAGIAFFDSHSRIQLVKKKMCIRDRSEAILALIFFTVADGW